jgi:hypothetical protein
LPAPSTMSLPPLSTPVYVIDDHIFVMVI